MATTRGQSALGVDDSRASVVRGLTAAAGALFLVVGIVGFFVTGFDNFAEHTDETLLGFSVNPLHNLVHVAAGIAGLVMARTLSSARAFGWLVVVLYGLTLLYGLVVADQRQGNVLSLNEADNWLHLGFVVIGLIIALLPVPTDDVKAGEEEPPGGR
jgi:hypothetical protein